MLNDIVLIVTKSRYFVAMFHYYKEWIFIQFYWLTNDNLHSEKGKVSLAMNNPGKFGILKLGRAYEGKQKIAITLLSWLISQWELSLCSRREIAKARIASQGIIIFD